MTHEIREFRPKFMREMRYKRDTAGKHKPEVMDPHDKYWSNAKKGETELKNREDLSGDYELENRSVDPLEKLQNFFNTSRIREAVDEAVLALKEFNGIRLRRSAAERNLDRSDALDSEVSEMMGHLEKEILGLQVF